MVRRADVLICITGALTGNVALVDVDLDGPAFVNQHVALVRPIDTVVYPEYLAFALHSDVGREQFKTGEDGGTKQGLGLGGVRSVFIPLPPLPEQAAICRELDFKLVALSRTKERTRTEIDLVREFRSRLIADVVSGRLDVREAAARVPDATEESEWADIDGENEVPPGDTNLENMEDEVAV